METLQTFFQWIGIGVVFIVLIAAIIVAVDAQRERYQNRCKRDLDSLYREIWTGQEEDRIYAWFRVIEHLKLWNYDEAMIRQATYRMNKLKEERSKKTYISKNGRLITTTKIS